MKTRLFALFLLAMSGPVAVAPPAWAQSTSDEATKNLARQRFKEGVAYFDKGQFEQARASFLQAYSLRNHPAILVNLAWSCLRSNRFLEAHRYFQQFLNEGKDITAAQRADVHDGLSQADARLTPSEISGASSPPPASAQPAPRPTAPVAAAPAAAPAPQAPPSEPATSTEPASGSHHAGIWPENMIPVYIGGGVVVVSAVVAIAADIAKGSAQSNANTQKALLVANNDVCPSPSTATFAEMSACATYAKDNDLWNQDSTVANLAIGVGVAALVGTVVYWVLAKKRGDEADAPATAAKTQLVPILGTSFGGLAASTAF